MQEFIKKNQRTETNQPVKRLATSKIAVAQLSAAEKEILIHSLSNENVLRNT